MEIASVVIERHCVENIPETGLSPLQNELLESPAKVRICSAPTGAGKSYAFQRAIIKDERVLFIVPTRRLAQNLMLSIRDSLVNDNGWTEEKVFKKLALWNSDETKRLKDAGETNIGARRIREINGLNIAIEGGEMIIAVPEVVSYLLLRYNMEKFQTDKGVFDFLVNFEHIVFDEFHTISARGFGLAALFAKLAAEFSGSRSKVTFLSATPIDIKPVLMKFDVPESHIHNYEETLTDTGRAVHGDVRLALWDCPDIPTLVKEHLDMIMAEINSSRQVVIIYNSLGDLQRHLPIFEDIFINAGINKGEILLINSLDDSRTKIDEKSFFLSGRNYNPENYKILIATASVEMGVTFKTNLLLMEPGFESANFLQRYGRAARGNHNGNVFLRVDSRLLEKNPWLRTLKKWMETNHGKKLTISALTDVLTFDCQKRFKSPIDEKSQKYFGMLPSRAAYSAGLYWNLLMKHFSNQGHRFKHLREHQPSPSKAIYGLIKTVRKMESDRGFGELVKKWCDSFEQEARTLRDIGKGIKVIEENGGSFYVQELWLRRNTDILSRFPVTIGQDDVEEVRIDGKLRDYQLDKKDCPFIKATRILCFPHTEYNQVVEDNSEIIKNWCKALKDGSFAWDDYPDEMEAVIKLVQMTGILVSDDTEMEAATCIL
ncbi:MAG: DEAD/DEAH box helicase [Desulfamplus sp.]|nr:DEAD/DEAH box helicase [Desulfamplus sp.]